MIGGERPKLSNRITDYKRKKKGKRFILYKKDNLYYCVDNDDTNLLNILKGSE